MKSLLEQFKAGEIAAKNDVTPVEMKKLLDYASPSNYFSGTTCYYKVSSKEGIICYEKYEYNGLCAPASQLLAELDALESEPEFKWGEELEFSSTGEIWIRGLFVGITPRRDSHYNKYVAIAFGDTEPSGWLYCRRPVPTITITLDEAKTYAAAVLGTTADKIEIK